VILTRIKSSLMMMISWWSKHVGVILSVLMCDFWINVLLQTSALVGQLHIVNWNARWNSEINKMMFLRIKYLLIIQFRQDSSKHFTWLEPSAVDKMQLIFHCHYLPNIIFLHASTVHCNFARCGWNIRTGDTYFLRLSIPCIV
jgi:hypothetical protein